jgi:hypothetical protein
MRVQKARIADSLAMHLFRSEQEQCTTNTMYNASAIIQNSPVVRSLHMSPGVGAGAHTQREGGGGVHSQRLSFSPRLPPPPPTTPSTVPALLHGEQFGVRALGGGEGSFDPAGVPYECSFLPETAFAEPDRESKLMVSMEEEFGEDLMLEMLQNTPQVLRHSLSLARSLSLSRARALSLSLSHRTHTHTHTHTHIHTTSPVSSLSSPLCFFLCFDTTVYLSSSLCSCVWWIHRMFGVFASYSNLSLSLTHPPPPPPIPQEVKKSVQWRGREKEEKLYEVESAEYSLPPSPGPEPPGVCVCDCVCLCVCVYL